jgi:hypothetical protein
MDRRKRLRAIDRLSTKGKLFIRGPVWGQGEIFEGEIVELGALLGLFGHWESRDPAKYARILIAAALGGGKGR